MFPVATRNTFVLANKSKLDLLDFFFNVGLRGSGFSIPNTPKLLPHTIFYFRENSFSIPDVLGGGVSLPSFPTQYFTPSKIPFPAVTDFSVSEKRGKAQRPLRFMFYIF